MEKGCNSGAHSFSYLWQNWIAPIHVNSDFIFWMIVRTWSNIIFLMLTSIPSHESGHQAWETQGKLKENRVIIWNKNSDRQFGFQKHKIKSLFSPWKTSLLESRCTGCRNWGGTKPKRKLFLSGLFPVIFQTRLIKKESMFMHSTARAHISCSWHQSHCSHFCMSYSSFSDPWWILNSFPLKDELRVSTLQHLPRQFQVTRLLYVNAIQSNSEDTTLYLDQLQQCFAII